ncbi:MAG: hypothetical protein GWN62_33235, partial [Aliifodinibius sp.]|nr:hypothetical protein [Fodinibius sp.]
MSIRNNINLLYKIRFPFLLLALIALLTGIWSGLQRVGWQFSFHPGISPVTHGPLMVSGFLGTLICLERAVALNRFWGYLAPLSSAAGALFILLDSGKSFGPLLIVLSSIFLLLILMRYLLRTRELHFVIMTIGPLLWLVGNILWLTKVGFYQMTPWWAGFLIFT